MTEVRRYMIMGSMGIVAREGLNTVVLGHGTDLVFASDYDALADRVQAVEREIASQEVQMNAVRYRAEQAEQQLAAMTAERDEAVQQRRETIVKIADDVRDQLTASQARVRELEVTKDGAYLERNHLVAALARCFPSGIRKTAIDGWSDDWHGCVYIDLPAGQISYHYHDSQAFLFESLPAYTKSYDGHTKDDVHERLKSATLQATLAERERVLEQQQATIRSYRHSVEIMGRNHDDRKAERDAARQDAARLRELLAISKCGTCDGSGWYQDTDPMTGGPVQAQCRYCFNKSSGR